MSLANENTVAETQEWQRELKFVVNFMRELSQQKDPQAAAGLYGRRLREAGLIPSDGFLALSRRDLKHPYYRITRSSKWTENINPWKEKHRLPLLSTGLLGEIIYAGEPAIIDDLPSHYGPDDPAAEYFEGMKLLIASPQFDDGEPLNWTITMARDPDSVHRERIPMMVMQANLWGRSVLSSVLREELKRAYDALDREMKAVGEIQRSLLPSGLPKIRGLDLAAHYETSQRAGGDYYDFFPLPENRWGFLIADVSGHGIPAAVVMAITHAIAHTRPNGAGCAGGLLSYVNTTLENRYLGQTGSFVTAFYAVYDPATRVLTYSSAGHPQPRMSRGKEVIGLVGPANLPLGIDSPVEYLEHEIQLQPGDNLVFYTDGVSEAFNSSGVQFGTDRIDAACLSCKGDATSLLKTVLADLKEHCGTVSAADDRTLLALCVK